MVRIFFSCHMFWHPHPWLAKMMFWLFDCMKFWSTIYSYFFYLASSLTDTIAESGARTLMATRQFLYLSRWWGNSTGSVRRHDLTSMRSYDVTRAAVRPGQMVYISNQTPNVQGGILYSSEYNVYFLINVSSMNEDYEQNSIFISIKTVNKGLKWQMSKVPVKV